MMKKSTCILAISLLSATSHAQMPFVDGFETNTVTPPTIAPPQAVFVSGHSLTDNPFADYLEHIAKAKGRTYEWNQQIGGGSPIRVRTRGLGAGGNSPDTVWDGYSQGKNKEGTDLNVINELRTPATIGALTQYDALLITERHDILNVIQWEFTNSLLWHYHNRLRAGNADGVTYFYHSWLNIAPENASITNPNPWINHERNALTAWQCVVSKVNASLKSDGAPEHVRMLPAGWALTYLVEAIVAGEVVGFSGTTAQRLDALFSDTVHLNDVGVFFVAAFSYAMMFDESPVGIPMPNGINKTTGDDLLAFAWQKAQDYRREFTQLPDMATCRRVIHDRVCRSHAEIDDPSRAALLTQGCQSWINDRNGSPFWDDKPLKKWPAP